MFKRSLLAVVLVLAMLAATGCSLIVKDEAVDRATVIIEVGDATITKGEIQSQTDYVLDYYEYMYSMYGMPYDRTDAATVEQARSETMTMMIQDVVVNQKIAEKGFDVFTAEEEASMLATAEETYQLYRENIELFYFSGTELTGEELDAAINAEMINQGYPTLEGLIESERLTLAEDRLYNDTVSGVTVTDEEVAAEYQARVDADKAVYDASPASYATAATGGSTVYYAPAGYRYVKHILLQFSAEDQAAIDEAEAKLAAATDEAETAQLQAEVDAAREAAYANLQPTVDTIAERLAAGEDFGALITEYNQDPGMTADSVGYLVCADSTNWVPEFTEGSMALANVGDVSGAVRSSYGIHIIQYASDVPAGEIGLDAVKDAIYNELLTTRQDEVYSNSLQQWVDEADVKIYENRL